MPLKITKTKKSPNWYIKGTIRGIAVEESTGTNCKKTAKEICDRRVAEVLDQSIRGVRETANWLEASIAYVDQGGEARFLGPINEHFRTTRLEKIGQAAIDAAARKIYPNAAPSTLNRQLYTPISAVLKFAASRDMCDEVTINRPKEPQGRVRWLMPDEAERLIDHCAPHLRPLVVFMLYTGARVSEALYLDWRYVDMQRAHVTFTKTKNGEARGVPLHPRVIHELALMPHESGSVFLTNRGVPYSRTAREENCGGQIKSGFNGACRRAGIIDFTPHDLRHTWATWHYQANCDLASLQTLGGWKSVKMVMRYAHTNTENHAAGIANLPAPVTMTG